MHKTMMKTESSAIRQLLGILYIANKNEHWFHSKYYMTEHNVCSVTSKPFQSSSRRVSFFKESLALLNI